MSKDIRFSEKKVDDSWKEQASKEKDAAGSRRPLASESQSNSQTQSQQPRSSGPQRSNPAFLNLLSSLGYQAMYHLGEIADPHTGETSADPQAAKEVIDLLLALKEKCAGNLSDEENRVFESILPELQMKFSQKV